MTDREYGGIEINEHIDKALDASSKRVCECGGSGIVRTAWGQRATCSKCRGYGTTDAIPNRMPCGAHPIGKDEAVRCHLPAGHGGWHEAGKPPYPPLYWLGEEPGVTPPAFDPPITATDTTPHATRNRMEDEQT